MYSIPAKKTPASNPTWMLNSLLSSHSLPQSISLQTRSSRPSTSPALLHFFTLDVISTVAFGQRFGFIAADDDPFGYIANLQQFLPAILIFAAYMELQKILRMPILKAVLPKSTDKRGLGAVMGFAKERISERFGDKPVVRQDMVGSFIKRGLSQEELESETLTQITTGSDSTASALRMTLYFISTNPRCAGLGYWAEAEAAIASERISRPLIKDAEARKLPYLQACIKEGLRMYPPVTGPSRQTNPEKRSVHRRQVCSSRHMDRMEFVGYDARPQHLWEGCRNLQAGALAAGS